MVETSYKKLLEYIESQNYKGYDPYDLKGQKWYIELLQKNDIQSKGFSNKLNELNFLFPEELRKIFNIKPKHNNKALALCALSYLNMYKYTQNDKYLKVSKQLAKKLLKRANLEYSGLCWGYPFNWQSGKFYFKKNTPSIVVTSFVSKVFLELYKITSKDKYLNVCLSVKKFILNDLNRTKLKKTICFSYTPHDNYQIHNANLMAAEFLCELGNIINSPKLIKLGIQSTYFTINQQNKDGSIYYFGNNSNDVAPLHLDIYHSGFEIRSLINIYYTTKDKTVQKAYIKYLEFFQNQYILDKKIPKLGPKIKNYNTDIVDIHGLAEAILTFTKTSSFDEKSSVLLENIIAWGIENMQVEQGWFIFRWIREDKKIKKVEFPFMRWGQAWMLYALSSYLVKKGEKVL